MRKWLHTSVNSSMEPDLEKEVSKKIEEKIKQFETYGWTLFSYMPVVVNEKRVDHFLLFYSDQQ